MVRSPIISMSAKEPLGSYFSGSMITEQKIQEDNINRPAMGYEIIKYAQENNIPLAVVSSIGHGQHCIPALFETGLADAESILRHESIRHLEKEKIPGARYQKEFRQQFQRLDAMVLDRAILVMENGKEQHTYDFAIDILEGKIDQTRPYEV